MTRSLEGRIALVTGGNHGIGAATAVSLARAGAAVVVTYLAVHDSSDSGIPDTYRRNRAASADKVIEDVTAAGGRAEAIEADLCRTDTPTMLFDVAERRFGGVDILVHNATGWVADTFKSLARDRLGRNLQRVGPETIDRASGGRIITLTSGGSGGFPEEVSYGAAKAALVNYTLSAATELADLGITANAVHPPVTDTGWVTEAVVQAVADSEQLVHIANPRDVAAVVTYLASEESWLLTGNVIRLR